MPKVDNKLKNIRYRFRYVGHTTTDSNNSCLPTVKTFRSAISNVIAINSIGP